MIISRKKNENQKEACDQTRNKIPRLQRVHEE